jgi:membrane protease YdiL (CAAX protease family)
LTDPSRPDGEGSSEPVAPLQSEDPSSIGAPAARHFGLTTFTIEGRRAPALFVVGWLATAIGLGVAGLTLLGITGVVGAVLWIAGLAAASLGLVLLGGSQTIERAAVGAPYAGPSPMLVFLAILATSQVAGFAVGLPLSAIGAHIPRPLGDLIGVLVQAAVFLGVLQVMVVAPGALSWSDMGVRRGTEPLLRSLLGGAVFAGPVILVTLVLAGLAVQVVGAIPESPLPPTGTPTGLLSNLLAAAIVAPLAEELLFRGFALSAWRRTNGARAAILRSSTVFVLAHVLFVGGDSFRDAAALAFVAGLVRVPVALTLGWLFTRTGSLWAPIGLHATYNAVLVIVAEIALRA